MKRDITGAQSAHERDNAWRRAIADAAKCKIGRVDRYGNPEAPPPAEVKKPADGK
jgi:hypothetical protein